MSLWTQWKWNKNVLWYAEHISHLNGWNSTSGIDVTPWFNKPRPRYLILESFPYKLQIEMFRWENTFVTHIYVSKSILCATVQQVRRLDYTIITLSFMWRVCFKWRIWFPQCADLFLDAHAYLGSLIPRLPLWELRSNPNQEEHNIHVQIAVCADA